MNAPTTLTAHESAASTMSLQAQAVCSAEHTAAQLEAAIAAQGKLVEWHQNCGKSALAREAFAVVRTLVAMRTPETVQAMEQARGLA
jgi:2-methylaconitate cis-trans-isomerase PrpF